MALFLDSLGLSKISENQAEILNLFADVQSVEGADYNYKTIGYNDGLKLVARVIKDGKDTDIIGVDSHIGNNCKWEVTPVMTLGTTTEIPAVVFSSTDSKKAFIVNLIEAGLSKKVLKENEKASLQVCGFPTNLAIYENRKDYESKVEGPFIKDQMLFPYYFYNLQSEDLTEEQKKTYSENVLFNIYCGEVISTRKVKFSKSEDYCYKSMVNTIMGPLELIYSSNIVKTPIKKGNYIVGSVYLSGKLSE
jgi:hypothetical protein